MKREKSTVCTVYLIGFRVGVAASGLLKQTIDFGSLYLLAMHISREHMQLSKDIFMDVEN